MTQAELAGKINVTDKAVSRWERGLGFPDINTLEPLPDALEIGVVELMRSEINTEKEKINKSRMCDRDYEINSRDSGIS